MENIDVDNGFFVFCFVFCNLSLVTGVVFGSVLIDYVKE